MFSSTLTDIKPFNNPSPIVFKQMEALKKIWGPFNSGFPNNNYMNPENKEPLDILMMYNGREVIIPANQIIAYLLNIRNETFLKYVMPWIYSNEVNWRTALREINLVTFAPVAEGAPFDTLTMRTGTWTDTTKKVKLGITIASGVYRDTIFGEDQFKFYMQGLAQSAQLTIMLKECFALTTLAYANACSDQDGTDYLDHSKVLNLTGSLFGILAHDPQVFYNRIEEIRRTDIPDLNTVIVPEKVLLFLDQLRGQPTTVLQEYIFPDNEVGKTNEVKIGNIKGPTSLTTINGISAFELKSFVLNSTRKQVIQPLKTTVVIARIWPHDPYDNHKTKCHETFNSCMLDRKIYCHTKTYGDERFIHYSTSLKHCFLFDQKTSKPSKYLMGYIDYLNKEILNSNEMPYKWKLLRDQDKGEFSVGSDDGYSNDKPIPGSFENKRTIEEQRGWRDSFCAATFNPKLGPNGTYLIPRRVGDMNKESLPNCDVQKVSDSMIMHLRALGIDLDTEINAVKRFVSLIDEAPWTNDYLNRLYIANLQRIKGVEGNVILENYEHLQEREAIYGKKMAQDWPSNIYGGFDLPTAGTGSLPLYPAGFASAAGIRTIAAQKNNRYSDYSGIAIEADRIVTVWESIVRYIQEYISTESDIIDKFHTRLWFSKCSGLDALFEHILPQKSPLFLGMYDLTYLKTIVNGTSWGRNDESYKTTALYLFFNANKDVKLYQKLIEIINTRQYFTEQDYTDVNDYVKGDFRFPEEIVSKRFWVLFILLSRKASLELTELSKSNKYSKETINGLTLEIMKHILGNTKITYNDITTAVKDPDFRKRIVQVQTFLKVLTTSNKKYDSSALMNPKLDVAIPNDETIPTAAEYTTNIDKYIVEKDIFTVEFSEEAKADFEAMQKIVNDKFVAIQPTGNKITITMAGTDIPEPNFYIRTPLTLSEQFIDFITTRPPGQRIDILPGDVHTNYNFPVNATNINENTFDTKALKKVLEESKIKLTSPKFDFSHFPVSEAFRLKKLKFNTKDVDDDSDDDYTSKKQGLFTLKQSHKKKKDYGDSVFSVFSKMGSSKMSIDAVSEKPVPTHYKQLKEPLSYKPGETGEIVDDTEAFMMEFPGPWNKNIEYYKKISSTGSALLFLGIIFSPFTMEVFHNVSKLGLHLLKIDLMRNSEEHDMSSCIVMTAGSGTALMVFGRIAVIPSIDGISGAITVSAEFHVGHVRINPKKISWLPYSVPYAFRGGCDDSFIEHPEQFFSLNATGRPSFFAVPVSVSLTNVSYPISAIGDGTYRAPDIDNTATIYRKYPSAGWIKWFLGDNRVKEVNIKSKARANYYQAIPISFICHLGCVRYPDRKGDFPKVKAGTGPKQYVEMNIDNAYLAWNGQGAFPKLTNSFKEY